MDAKVPHPPIRVAGAMADAAVSRAGAAGPEALGPLPEGDGWGGVYRLYEAAVGLFPRLSGLVRGYFWPRPFERARGGLLFRVLGVPWFGRLLPTGGITVRRLTGTRMAPYTLTGASLPSARAFFYRASIFEALHLVPMVVLVGLSVQRIVEGRPDLALENTAVNLVVNVYPILHHRHTRVRILRLLDRDARRRGVEPAGRQPVPGRPAAASG